MRVPAKVNLALSVGPLGEDGYHELVTVFHAVSVVDEVTAHPADGFSVSVTPGSADAAGPPRHVSEEPSYRWREPSDTPSVPLGEGNLAVRAARLLAEWAGRDAGAELRIRKSIPVAGGMAGGSADAAAALVACDLLWNTAATPETLLGLAARLGADVAFPLLGGTAAGYGRGERLTPLTCAGILYWVFALGTGGLSTAAVYAECDRLRARAGTPVPAPHQPTELVTALDAGDPAAVGAALHNDLQPAALNLRPGLARTLDTGREAGALGAVLCGSGPTCAFLAGSAAHAAHLAGVLESAGVCRAARCAHGPASGAMLLDRPGPP